MQTANFSHTGSIGDVIASVPTMNEYYRKTGRKVMLYLVKDTPAVYHHESVTHPTKDAEGNKVLLNEQVINMLIPLLKAQESIEDVRIWKDEKIFVGLEDFRDNNVGLPGLSISRWYFYVRPDLACDLTKQWLTVPDSDKDLAKGKVIITRSERYTNVNINYGFLKPYEDNLIFSGTMREYNNFCMTFDLNIKKLTITNFLELAQAIKQSRFHLSNQTMAFQISEGLRHPRILETCAYAPNVIVFGEDAYDFLAQSGAELYFYEMYKKTIKDDGLDIAMDAVRENLKKYQINQLA